SLCYSSFFFFQAEDGIRDLTVTGVQTCALPILLLLQLLLGLQPNHRRHVLETAVTEDLPSWVGDLRLSGIRAFDRQWDVRVEGRSEERRVGKEGCLGEARI